jgi:hypothetical protein
VQPPLQTASRAWRSSGRRTGLGEIAGLLEALDGAEDQLDGPLGAQPLGLQRVGDAEAADREVRPVGAHGRAAIQVAALDEAVRAAAGTSSAAISAGRGIGRRHLDQLHAALALQEARQRHLQLRVRQEADALAGELLAL